MVTLRNSHNDPLDSKGVGRLLLGKLILISSCSEHMTSAYGDMLKYVHEKPAGYNIREKGTGERGGYKTFEGEIDG